MPTRRKSTTRKSASATDENTTGGRNTTGQADKSRAGKTVARGRKTVAEPRSAGKPEQGCLPRASSPLPAKGESGAAPRTRLGKKDLLARVVERSGHRKRDVKPVMEAMLAVLGEALAAGEDLNLPPFGKLGVRREKENDRARILICRIRQPKNRNGAPRSPLQGRDEQIK